MILACDFVEGVAGLDGVIAPVAALVCGNLGDALFKDIFCAGGQVQFEGLVGRSGISQQAGIEAGDLLHGRPDEIGNEREVDAVVGLHAVVGERRIGSEVAEAVLLRVLRHDGDGEDDRDIVSGFSRKVVALVELPEVGITSALHGMLNIRRAPVIGGHGEIPIAELLVEILDVVRVGDGGGDGIEAVVEPCGVRRSVRVTGHELPHASSAGVAIDDLGAETGFSKCLIDEVLGYALLLEYLLDQGFIAAEALERGDDGSVSALAFGKEVDVAGDVVVHDQRKIGVRGLQLRFRFGADGGIYRKGDVVGDADRSIFSFGGEAVALLESVHFDVVDGVDDVFELGVEFGRTFDVDAAGEHLIDGVVEVGFGGGEVALLIVGEAILVCNFDIVNDLLDMALHCGFRLRWR